MTLVGNERTKTTVGGRATNAAPSSPDRLAEVAYLASLLAERVVVCEGGVSADQAIALAKAARLLQDHDVEWPPTLAQAIYELAEGKTASSTPTDALARSSVEGVVISMASFAARARPQSR